MPIFILSIHFRKISLFKITKDTQSNNIVLSMLYAEIYPKVRRHNTLRVVHYAFSYKFRKAMIKPENDGKVEDVT